MIESLFQSLYAIIKQNFDSGSLDHADQLHRLK